MRRLLVLGCWIAGLFGSQSLSDFPGTASCLDDKVQLHLPKELETNHSWQVKTLGAAGEEVGHCAYAVDDEAQTLTILYINCTNPELVKRHPRLKVTGPSTNLTYNVDCDALQADVTPLPRSVASATNCTRDFMAVVFPRLIPGLHDEHTAAQAPMEWVVSIEDRTKTHTLNLQQAMQQGYTFLTDGSHIIFQVSFDATGVTAYKGDGVLYTVALKLTYGPPERRLTVESRMVCAPGPATCNATHMTIAIPDFPGTLAALSLDNKNIPVSQRQADDVSVDLRRGVKLHINKKVLRSRVSRDDGCAGFRPYASPLKLSFNFRGEMATMITHPECPCEQNAPLAATCTRDGHMDFEVSGSSTRPALNLATVQLRDPACKPVSRSPSGDTVQFHVPLSGCGTRQRFDGEKMVYENEVSALWMDLPPRRISRDSQFRLTVVCFYGSDDASLNVKAVSLPPPERVVNQGPLSLILLLYPDDSYRQPYSESQHPVVKYLRQPIFLEVQVLNRNDPGIHLALDDCWATLSLDPASFPRWSIVVDGCDYELDAYKTVFHPMSRGVAFPNFRQRLEVKAFAFVSGGKALPSLVYFHCSALICDRLHPDSPLCSARCPPSRSRRDLAQRKNSTTVTLPHPVLLVPDKQPSIKGQQNWSGGLWVAALLMTAVTLGLVAAAVVTLALFKIQKKQNQ
ncbi:zona pellucida sperm-binding protein 2 isoform X2 [Paroedura picta]|uniref:zona pellucida sperm-binding protein 2 isoform X2 n=1 Tax=Paroedura picta TaxID=143630 RepID=UPI00405723D1